jgi:hypothetical protein
VDPGPSFNPLVKARTPVCPIELSPIASELSTDVVLEAIAFPNLKRDSLGTLCPEALSFRRLVLLPFSGHEK